MDGIPESTPNELAARQIALGYNFTPVPRQFYDQLVYASGDEVFKFAVGNKTINIEFLTDGSPG